MNGCTALSSIPYPVHVLGNNLHTDGLVSTSQPLGLLSSIPARVGGHHSTSPTRSADQHCISALAQFGRSSDNAHTAVVCSPRLRTCRTQQQRPPRLLDPSVPAVYRATPLTVYCTNTAREE